MARSALQIIQLMLEELLKSGDEGLVKSKLYKRLNLRTSIGEKYLQSLIDAGYISLTIEPWGKKREKHVVRIEKKGKARFEWFLRLNNELDI